eukprot:CAMPEP_0114536250 /NCGR_PEP_ID=MMETSP0109-20121206/28886_1 /TAXON_ID=29199 /ORGANISM="Chlorarachnion reptans, Strain CCCM449" /LENGTH=251 /DNA_ID=CAMNT_0001719943 /DNA_START=159 /DNA_END=915 /DNA_ORIENTATION=+
MVAEPQEIQARGRRDVRVGWMAAGEHDRLAHADGAVPPRGGWRGPRAGLQAEPPPPADGGEGDPVHPVLRRLERLQASPGPGPEAVRTPWVGGAPGPPARALRLSQRDGRRHARRRRRRGDAAEQRDGAEHRAPVPKQGALPRPERVSSILPLLHTQLRRRGSHGVCTEDARRPARAGGLEEAIGYISQRPEIRDVLVSGGDCSRLSPDEIKLWATNEDHDTDDRPGHLFCVALSTEAFLSQLHRSLPLSV